jgi:hypothetical protein
MGVSKTPAGRFLANSKCCGSNKELKAGKSSSPGSAARAFLNRRTGGQTNHWYAAGKAVVAGFARAPGCRPDRGAFDLYSMVAHCPAAALAIHTASDASFKAMAGGSSNWFGLAIQESTNIGPKAAEAPWKRRAF